MENPQGPPSLGVNIDHVATVRNARGEGFPSPLQAAFTALEAGASNVTCHLREDRRHIRDDDVRIISSLTGRLNLEMAAEEGIIKIALEIKPLSVTIVPEKRKELTTEGGLNVIQDVKKYSEINSGFRAANIATSAFIEPDLGQVEAAKKGGFDFIEIHTGNYAREFALVKTGILKELEKIKAAAAYAGNIGLGVNAGHGLDYKNIYNIAAINGMREFNIGFSIISHSIFAGLETAVREMASILRNVRR